MKCSLVRLAMVLCLLLGPASSVFADEPPSQVRAAAEEALPGWLGLLAKSPPEHTGLTDPSQLNRATLGEPYQVYTISQEKLAAYDGRSSVRPLLSESDRWIFPILIEGKTRSLLEVALQGGQWKAVRIGNAPQAEDLDEIARQIPAVPEGSATEGQREICYVRALSYYDFVLTCGPTGESAFLPRWARLFDLPQRAPIEPKLWITQIAAEAGKVAAKSQVDGGAARQVDGGVDYKTDDSTPEEPIAAAKETASTAFAPAPVAVALGAALISMLAITAVSGRKGAHCSR